MSRESEGQLPCTFIVFILTSLFSWSVCTYSNPVFDIPGLNHKAYVKPGDINIGALIRIYGSTNHGSGNQCDRFVLNLETLQEIEALAFAVNIINSNTSLLPNVTLGFVILDECDSENTVLAQALSFLPTKGDYCPLSTCNSSSSAQTSPATSGHYDVIGVIGPKTSDKCMAMSLLYSIAQIPMISTRASSDIFSDKTRHRYFLRVLPPDTDQVRAILTFITENNWSYISVVYSYGYYGETAFETMKTMSDSFGICIASSHKVESRSNFAFIAKELWQVTRARVVILFINAPVIRRLMGEIQKLNRPGHFIFIGSDASAGSFSLLTEYAEALAGAFTFSIYTIYVRSFDNYFRAQRPSHSSNPWLGRVWEMYTNCSLGNNTCNLSQGLPDLLETFSFSNYIASMVDAVLTFAIAADALLMDRCRSKVGANARHCIDGETFLQYLLKVSFIGYSGHIQFDKKGEFIGKYLIKQVIPTRNNGGHSNRLQQVSVAHYSVETRQIEYLKDNISWEFFDNLDRIVPLSGGENPNRPESVCSRPCEGHEYKNQRKVDCCWECKNCRANERLVNEQNADVQCDSCPKYTWPDPLTNMTTCQPIPLTYPSMCDSLSLVIVCFSIIALVATILTILGFIYLKDARVIKAASRELSFLQLGAICVGYITVTCLHSKPTPVTCRILYILFCLSFTWLYSPLLVKAIRVFRIFHYGARLNQRPWFISPMSQVVIASLLISVQVVICICVLVTSKPSSKLTQLVTTEKFVELSCDMTLAGLSSFLAYNLLLVLLCSVFAFKTRKLPDNFNESRFTSMCVSTTLVIWLAFIPTYLTATQEYAKVLLLSAALILNHTVALIFLFLPKIYAGIYLPQESVSGIVSNKLQNSVSTKRSGLQPTPCNKISPKVITDSSQPEL